MSDNITVTLQLSGGESAVQSFNLEDDMTAPPPPMDDGSMDVSFDGDNPEPPPEIGDGNNAEVSTEFNQTESANAPPPDYDDDAEVDTDESSDELNDGPPPPEV